MCVCVYLCVISVCTYVCSPGFQVVGGENSGRSDLGTIISSITPGGPADVNGCLKPGRVVFCFMLPPVWVDYDSFFVVCYDNG